MDIETETTLKTSTKTMTNTKPMMSKTTIVLNIKANTKVHVKTKHANH